MICLTGDLHHQSLGTGNQKACDISEIQVAQRYLAILEKHNLKCSFFVSGQAFAEEWIDLKPICEHPLIEIGGHNYSCVEPSILHRVWKKLTGNYNGPHYLERRDVRRCIEIVEQKCGQRITAWRNRRKRGALPTGKKTSDASV